MANAMNKNTIARENSGINRDLKMIEMTEGAENVRDEWDQERLIHPDSDPHMEYRRYLYETSYYGQLTFEDFRDYIQYLRFTSHG